MIQKMYFSSFFNLLIINFSNNVFITSNLDKWFFFQDRIAFRRDLFVSIDKTHTGQITFNEWLEYAYPHIVAKVNYYRFDFVR